jgi:hypothetical protein
MHSTRSLALLAALCLVAGGCRRKAPPRTVKPGDPGACPAPDALARLVQESGRTVKSDCVSYAPGFFWLGVSLSHDAAGATPRMSLIYGGQPLRAFPLEPLPLDVLTRLIKDNPTDLRVSIRKPTTDSHLVRIGVFGLHGGERTEADEMVAVLKLVAHAPPQLLWTGPGDQVRTTADGCVAERTVDFDVPFGDKLEMTTMSRSHRKDPKGKATCPGVQNTQQTLDSHGQALPASRVLP